MPSILAVSVLCLFAFSSALASDAGEKKPAPGLTGSIADAGGNFIDVLPDDAGYFFGSMGSDIVDMFQLPGEENQITAKDIVLGTALAGAIPATIYGLDSPIRRNISKMKPGAANALNYVGLGATVGSLGAVYGWGVLTLNDDARHVALTGVSATGMASLLNLGLKFAFRRQRPSKDKGPLAFFKKGGDSFPSGQSTLAFAAAAAFSEGFNNRWWAAVPAYGFAAMTGIGRMGKDAHWASDVLASSLIGVGSTELLFYLHRRREWPTSSLTIVPMVEEHGVAGASLGFSW